MADKNNKEITAKSLLGRLRVGKDAEEKIPNAEIVTPADELVAPDLDVFEDGQEIASALDATVVADAFAIEPNIENFIDEIPEAPEMAFDEPVLTEEAILEEMAALEDAPVFEELVELPAFDDIADAPAFDEPASEDTALEDVFAELSGEDGALEYAGEDYAEYAKEPFQQTMSTIDTINVLEVAETSDDFDNDPLEEAVVVEEDAADLGEPVEYDEITDFENLVSEVMSEKHEVSDELSNTDISLMVALGMEDELVKSMGETGAVEVTDDFIAEQEEWVDKAEHYGPGEYTDMSQNRKIAVEYTKKNKWGLVRLALAAILTIAIFFYENLPVFGYQVSGFADPKYYPVVYVMLGLQMLFFLVAIAFPSVVAGAKNLFALKITASSMAFVASVASALNTIHICIGINAGVEPRLFNLPAAICLFMVVASEFYTNRREIFSFNIVSSKNPKYVMRRLNTKDSKLENQAVADLSEDNSGDIVKIAKTDFVEGYFWRTNNRGTVDKPFVTLLLILSVVFALIIGLYVLLTDRIGSAVETAFISLMMLMPVSTVLIGFLPFYLANKEAYYNDCTIIGEGSVEEYSDTEVISFDDVNVFPSVNVKVRNVRLYNNCRIDKVLYYAASVFSATGGPLADVFEVATIEMGRSEDVQILETGAGFIEATVNGKNVLFAKEEALLSRGITIPENVLASDDENDFSPDTSVMYMIYQGRLVSKMILSYVVDADFEYIIRQLSDSGMYVCVKTFDPNIDETLINRQVAGDKYPLKVIKYKGTEEITKYSERTDGGIVSRGTTKALLQTISYCDRIVGAKKTGYVISVIATIISVLLICASVVTGKFNEFYSIVPALNQLVWLIPVALSTKIILK